MAVPNWLAYANQGATRSLPLSNKLIEALSFLPEMGVTMKVFSGGQPSEGPNRVGSHRHDMGNAADAFFYKDGRQLNWENPNDRPIFEQIVERGKANGITGFGAGEGYMRPGSMHIGFGTPAVWGAGGKGANAPDWLRMAYNEGPGVPSPAQAPQSPQGALASPGLLQTPATQPSSASPVPVEVAQYALTDDKKGSPFQSLLKGIADGIPNPPPPRPGAFPGGPSSAQANGLLKAALAGPAIANLLMSKRV